MDKLPVLATGLSGLVGTKVAELLQDSYEFTNLDLTTNVDITNFLQVQQAINLSAAECVLHLAAFTDVNAAWRQRGDQSGLCYRVNVQGTRNIVRAAQEAGKHIIHMSTAYIFDGTKDTAYVEDDAPSPIEWYGETKAAAEKIVREQADNWTILRIDQPFRADPFAKPDTTHKLLQAIQEGRAHPFVDHWFAPTIIEDLAQVIGWILQTKTTGIWHATCDRKLSDWEYAQLLCTAQHVEKKLEPGSLTEYLKNLDRPYARNTGLSSKKLHATHPEFFTSLETALQRVQLATS